MSANAIRADRLLHLAEAICDETATEQDAVELDAILLADADGRRRFLDYCQLHFVLESELKVLSVVERVHQRIELEPDQPVCDPSLGLGFLPTVHGSLAGGLSSGWPVAYLIATVIVGLGLTIAAFMHVSRNVGPANQYSSTVAGHGIERVPPTEVVGRITALADCKWAGGAAESPQVPLGRKYELASGLLEITYTSGAKVILQGPVAYEVESACGGYLSVGRLTARLETKSEVGDQRSEPANQKSETRSPTFSIRTPTAVVTDLGTEFGVEVDRKGETTSHVFRGTVKVELSGGDAKRGNRIAILRENESIRTEKDEEAGDSPASLRRVGIDPGVFTRRIDRAAKALDLLDVVAGGDGFGRGREFGIDPGSGMESSLFSAEEHDANQFHRISLQRFIDGVFVPAGNGKPTVLDSAGHTFDGFGKTCGKSYGLIWARAAGVSAAQRNGGGEHWVYRFGGEQFMPNGRGLLCMHANAGITFNLEAMRKVHARRQPVRFKAVAGVAKVTGTGAAPNGTVYRADFSRGIEGWDQGGDGPYWDKAGGQDGGGYAGAVRTGFYPYLAPPIASILYGDLPGNFGSSVIRFSYYLKNIGGEPVDGGRLSMFADCDGDGSWDTHWTWTPSDTSVPRQWRQYTWIIDTDAEAVPEGWERTSGTGSWAKSWRRVKYWNFWGGRGSGEIKNGIDSVEVSGLDPEMRTQASGASSVARVQLADVWVFVDGRVRFKRTKVRPEDGGVPIDVELGDGDRLLTIAATDGGNGNWCDRVVFGDTLVELAPSQEDLP